RAGALCVYRFTYGCAADHGGMLAPGSCTAGASGAPAAGMAASVAAPSAAPAPSPCCKGFSPGSSSQPNCSCTLYASARSTSRQLSIEPVGHGGTQAMQPLQMSGSTT